MKTGVVRLLSFVPKKYLSYLFGRFAAFHFPAPLQYVVLKVYATIFRIDVTEADKPLSKYSTLNEFFTRTLKPGARPVGQGWVHPCDGFLKNWGRLNDNTLIEAKGIFFPLSQFLMEGDLEAVKELENSGTFLNYYLHPMNYHRVHAPSDGEVVEVRHVSGELWPVNNWAAKNIPQLFTVNERVVYKIRTQNTFYYLVMVAAYNVGNISVSFDASVRTNAGQWSASSIKPYGRPHQIKKGQEIGIFHMGSTVVILAPPDLLTLPTREQNTAVRMGVSLS